MTKQPKVRKPHPVLHGIGLVLSAILLVAVLAGTYFLSTMATIIDSFIGAPSGHYSDAEIADTKVKAEALAADVEAEGTVLVQNNDNTLPLSATPKGQMCSAGHPPHGWRRLRLRRRERRQHRSAGRPDRLPALSTTPS